MAIEPMMKMDTSGMMTYANGWDEADRSSAGSLILEARNSHGDRNNLNVCIDNESSVSFVET